MTNQPSGWALTTLGALGSYVNGRAFKSSEWSEAGRPIIRIQNLTGSGASYNYYSGIPEDRHIVRKGDLLISWAATLGAFIWDGPEGVLNQHIFKVDSFIDKKFHYYLIGYLISDLQRQTHGSGMVHVTRSRFDETSVSLPPMAEQQRIVLALEDHLSRVDSVASSVQSAQRKQRLLSRRLFDARVNALNTPTFPLSSVLREPLCNGRSVPTDSSGFPVLRLTALRNGRLALSERKSGRWNSADAAPFLVRRGDFFISRGNGSLTLVGRGALLEDEPDPIAFPDTMIRIRVDEQKMSSEFLRLAWDSRPVRIQIESNARTTAGIYKINQSIAEAIRVPVPDMSTQRQIVSHVRQVLDGVGRATDQINLSVVRAKRLRRSLLEEAFAGRLVEQDVADEPASALLARIREERAAQESTLRPRRGLDEIEAEKEVLF